MKLVRSYGWDSNPVGQGVVLKRERDTRDLSLCAHAQGKCQVRIEQEAGLLQARKRDLSRSQLCCYLDLELLFSRTVGRYISVV